jgi:hypothetical protein
MRGLEHSSVGDDTKNVDNYKKRTERKKVRRRVRLDLNEAVPRDPPESLPCYPPAASCDNRLLLVYSCILVSKSEC